MPPPPNLNESLTALLNNILNGTQLSIYANKILLTLGGIAGLTLIYCSVMLYLNYKQYKEEQRQTMMLLEQKSKIDEIFEKVNKQ